MAVVYAAVGLAVWGGAEIAVQALDLPEWCLTFVVVLTLIGFPIALVLAWVFEVRPEEPGRAEPPAEQQPPAEAAGAPAGLAGTEQRTSIVVLPFDNLSPDPGDAYFSDGLTEEIITHLSCCGLLRVISRNSAMALKDTRKDTRSISRELDVQCVLEGSVRKAGEDLRITAQLIDAETDTHLWAETYNGTIQDVFDFQETVARSIVDALQLQLGPNEERHLSDRPLADARAYECYLRAKQEFSRWSQDGIDRGLALLREGRALVGDSPLLLATKGYGHVIRLKQGFTQDPEAEEAAAQECLTRLQEIDAESEHVPFLSAMIAFEQGRIHEAILGFQRTLSLAPSHAEALLWLVVSYAYAGRTSAAKRAAEQLIEVDPLTPYNRIFPPVLDAFEGDHESAVERLREVYAADRENPDTVWIMGLLLAFAGKTGELSGVVEELVRLAAEWVYTHQLQALAAGIRGDREAARNHVTEELVEAARRDAHLSAHLAESYSVMGAIDEALDALENAARRGFIHYHFFSRHDPLLENLRGDERFQALMEKVKSDWESFAV